MKYKFTLADYVIIIVIGLTLGIASIGVSAGIGYWLWKTFGTP